MTDGRQKQEHYRVGYEITLGRIFVISDRMNTKRPFYSSLLLRLYSWEKKELERDK